MEELTTMEERVEEALEAEEELTEEI